MKYWIIEVIQNIDILCNVVFWFLTCLFALGSCIDKGSAFHPKPIVIIIWLIAMVGVIFIPSKEVMVHIFLG
ncbi:Uncharacterised protein [Neisseria animaloris]|uniref:hypothetical protein n=1 Tax=Neisseria animaloris TaxID=326522 RepID=UPI000A18DC14|nr:hypothetical protein [Neisseria animaloris]OSI06800.1 hypothetical protein BWD08_10585 [Neisseria animaloris]VEH86532.1 Uncharacterised protein [Neisseria animaloris]